jgi:MFS transporter, FSR family, fosmidomycin resistance protein
VGGSRAAAWPLVRRDLGLSYAQVGLVLAIPGLIGSALDPLIGVLGDTRRRRALLVGGGAVVAASVALTAGSTGFWILLAALALGNPATGAFVSLAQATLMDLDPARRERNMARWTLAGSLGYVAGPLLLAAAVALGLGWRGLTAGLAVAAAALTLASRRMPMGERSDGHGLLKGVRSALAELRRREVLRWLGALEASDLMLDVLYGFLALYFVDVVGTDAVTAGLAVGVWTGAGLAGDALLLLVLRRVRGTLYLRRSAAAALAVYPAFLVLPGITAKLVLVALLGLLNSGWYAIPKASLYAELPDRSGTAVALGSVGGLAGALVPLGLGLLAGAVGLGVTMWTLLAAPVVLLALVPSRLPPRRPGLDAPPRDPG